MSMRKKKGMMPEEEYTEAHIQQKFYNIPKLTEDELKIVRTSWCRIKKKKDEVGLSTGPVDGVLQFFRHRGCKDSDNFMVAMFPTVFSRVSNFPTHFLSYI